MTGHSTVAVCAPRELKTVFKQKLTHGSVRGRTSYLRKCKGPKELANR